MSEQNVDQKLVERVQRGDKNAFNLLVTKYQHKVANLVSRYIKNQSDVPDVVQEAFIKAYRALPNFRGESAFYTWLYRIAINASLNHFRKIERNKSVSLDDENSNIYTIKSDNYFDGNQAQVMLASAIDTLPEKQKIVFNLRYYDEMPYKDMSEVLSTSVGALKASYHLAAKKIENITPIFFDKVESIVHSTSNDLNNILNYFCENFNDAYV